VRSHRNDTEQDFTAVCLYLTGFRQRTFYGRSYVLKERISMSDLIFRAQAVMSREIEVIKAQLHRNGVNTFEGEARFIDSHAIEIKGEGESHCGSWEAEKYSRIEGQVKVSGTAASAVTALRESVFTPTYRYAGTAKRSTSHTRLHDLWVRLWVGNLLCP
jgi:hypothetical protein